MEMSSQPALNVGPRWSPANARPRVLLAEDEPEIFLILQAYLEREGMAARHATDGPTALALHRQWQPDLVLLDIALPGLDGWGVLSELRRRGDTPVIMLTARDQDLDKLLALRGGADDYVVKPFNPAEVAARVQAVLRRSAALAPPPATTTLRCGPLRLDVDNFEAWHEEADAAPERLQLTATEFRLLAHLLKRPGRVATRLELLEACLPDSGALSRTVDSHFSKLRRKLRQAGLPNIVVPVHSVGYRAVCTP
jgi:two-component system response regulator AdeR